MSEPVNNLLSGYLQPDQRRRIANALMANQFDRPTPQDGPVVERAGLLPLGTYANGQTGIAWPSFIAQPVESFNNLLLRGYQGGTGDTQGVEDAFNVAGGAMTGGLLAPRPRGSLGMSGRITQAEAMPRTESKTRLSEDFGEPTLLPSGQMAAGQTVPVLSRPRHLQGQAPHTTIEDDLLPSASFAPWTVEGYNVSPAEVGPLRQMLQDQFVAGKVPDGWHLHGRSRRGDLDTGHVIQGSEQPDIATQYAGRRGGSIWAMRPADGARSLDFTSDVTRDVRRTAARALQDYRDGLLPYADDLQGASRREMSQEIRNSFTPPKIVNSAGAFDNPQWVEWLYDRIGAEYVRTPDGAVGFSPDSIKAIRLFANGGVPSASVGAINNLLNQYGYNRPQKDWSDAMPPGDLL